MNSAGAYDYANARVHGLRGRLLKPAEVEALATRASLSDLIIALTTTDYGIDLERSRHQATALALIDETLRRNLSRRLAGLRGFVQPPPTGSAREPAELVDLLLARYDMRNLVAILRGKAAGASGDEIHRGIVPAGRIREQQLAQLLQATDLPDYLRQLRAGVVPYAAGLVSDTLSEADGWNVPKLELALRQGFFDSALAELGRSPQAAVVRDLLILEMDGTNLLAVVRLIQRGIRLPAANVDGLLLHGAGLSTRELVTLAEQPNVAEAISRLHRPWRRALRNALSDSSAPAPNDAIAVEWAIEGYLARWAEAQVYRDPMGIGLTVAYIAAKVEEVRRLSVAARAIAARWPQDRLRQMLAAGAARVVVWQTS